MVEKVLFLDFNKKNYVPEECLYTASLVGREIGFDNLHILRISKQEHLALLEPLLKQCEGRPTAVFCWLYDTFVPSSIAALFLPLMRRFRTNPLMTITVSGWQPTLATELCRSSGLFDHVITGWPWMAPLDWLDATRPKQSMVIRQQGTGYPDSVNYMDAFERIVNVDSCIFKGDGGSICFTYPFEKACTRACKFCFSNAFHGEHGGNIRKTPERATEELLFLKQRLGTNRVLITDFRLRIKNVELMHSKGFEIAEQVDLCVSDLSPAFLDIMHEAKLDTGFVGIESLVPRVQKDINKYYALDKFAENLEYGARKGLMFEGGIVLGLGSTVENPLTIDQVHEQVAEAIRFYRQHPNLRILFYPLIPLIGSPLGDEIWDKDPRPLDLESYFDLVARTIEVRDIPANLPLPRCYADKAVYDEIRRVTEASIALVRHKTSLFRYPPKNPLKRDLCHQFSEHMYDMMAGGYYGFSKNIHGMVDTIAKWV
ncbi:radical SAM protein [Humidesulfovibrio sp.]